jgi:hypothetical protein
MKLLRKLRKISDEIKQIKYDNHDTRLLIGSLLAKSVRTANSIKEAEFKVFSQFGDDGIIQFLINQLDIVNRTFVEFGVETYEESNTRFLLLNDNWRGLVIDGSKSNIDYIKSDPIYWRHELTAVESFITTKNIDQLLCEYGYKGKIGLLSIDIDGNDYWVWQAITAVDADIVVIEYNSLFGNERTITIPYKDDFVRSESHYSNLYFGASLPALYKLGESKGYSFVGCNQAGNNAYFVKRNMMIDSLAETLQSGYVQASFREGRDENGLLTFSDETNRKKEISGLSVINTKTGLTEEI